jgi:hypothetical protein
MKKKYLKELKSLIDECKYVLETEINPDTGFELTNEECLLVERELERLERMQNNPL